MGKSTGKAILSIAGLAFGAFNPNVFGMGAVGTVNWAAGIYGMSLTSSIWSATHPAKQPTQTYDFDALMDKVSSEAMIPIIYGTRKWGGYQTW